MDDGYPRKRIEPIAVLLLSIITCGIYGAYWLYVTGKDINHMLGREAVNPMFAVIGFFCAPLTLYYLYTMDGALAEIGQVYGIAYRPNFLLWLLLTLLCGIGLYVAFFQIAGFLNRTWEFSG